MKRLLLMLALSSGLNTSAQTEQDYIYAVERFRNCYNAGQADSIFGMFAPAMQANLPLDKTRSTANSLMKQLGALKSAELMETQPSGHSYKAVFDKGTAKLILALNDQKQLSGLWVQPYTEPVKPAAPVTDFELQLPGGSKLYGTMDLPPSAKGPVPIVLIIAGSGPTDRNCNSSQGLHTDAYRMLADSLAAHGIATLRYDKRGVGKSMDVNYSESRMRFDDGINDAVALLGKLKSDKRFSKVYVLGHSEGALVGLEAALQVPVAGYISLAGIAGAADKTIVRQLSEQSPELGKKAEQMFKELHKGKVIPNTEPMLESLFRESVQPYLLSWIKYDPAADIRKLKVPMLILQGTADIQVTVADAKALHAAAPASRLVIIDGMNHILKDAPADRNLNMGTYTNPNLPLNSALVEAICSFIP